MEERTLTPEIQEELNQIKAFLKKTVREAGQPGGENEKMITVSVIPNLINKDLFLKRPFETRRYGFLKLGPLLKVMPFLIFDVLIESRICFKTIQKQK